MTPHAETILSEIQQLIGRRDQIRQQLADLERRLSETNRTWQRHEGARLIGQWLTERTREQVRAVFSSIGTAALQAVFGPTAGFSIESDVTESGQRRAFLTAHDGSVSGDVADKSGNSVAAVLSTMLRRAVIIMHPKLDNILIADEPLYGIDASRFEDMARIERQMVDDHGMQIVVITHGGAEDYDAVADVSIRARKEYIGAGDTVGVTRLEIEDRREKQEV